MDFDDDDVEEITNIVQKLGWHKFTQTPPSTVAPIVEEFCANLLDSYNGKTRVRGKEVKFDAETTNQYYELPQVEEDEYEEYLKNVDYDKQAGCDTSRYKLSEMIYRLSEAGEEDDEEASDESMEE
ncbi:hypothetical protein Patl1_36768 [Pistacia atlantica]|nr:hypothetical protein Patl1_36768 [Pistacia atlantica]